MYWKSLGGLTQAQDSMGSIIWGHRTIQIKGEAEDHNLNMYWKSLGGDLRRAQGSFGNKPMIDIHGSIISRPQNHKPIGSRQSEFKICNWTLVSGGRSQSGSGLRFEFIGQAGHHALMWRVFEVSGRSQAGSGFPTENTHGFNCSVRKI